MRIVHERGHGLGRADADAWDASQQQDRRRQLGPTIQFLFDASQLSIQRLDFFQEKIPAQFLRRRRQGQLTKPA
jgi:hypothetical protein